MSIRGPFPSKDADFNDYFQHAQPYLLANATRLSVSAGNQTALGTVFSDWNSIYPQSQNPGIRTTSITIEKNNQRDEIEDLLRSIYGDIPESVLTAQDRETLNLHERDTTPTHINPANYAPGLSIDSILTGSHTLRISNPGNPNTQAMPEGNKVEIQYCTGADGLPPAQLVFSNSKTTGRFLLHISFQAGDKGKTAYYRARYTTRRGEGDWSAVISALIA